MKVHTFDRLDDALQLLAESKSPLVPIAGGTDLLVSWHHRPKQGLQLLDLSRLNGELRSLRLTDDHVHLGALTTYWDVLTSTTVCEAFPLLRDAARQVGALQIQTRGTWAGNIGNGSPAADGVPVLMAYDATVLLQSIHGQREVPLHQYWTGYKKSVRRSDELIVAIRLPRRKRTVEWFHKVGARTAQTITKVGVAMTRDETGWRVCANSVAPYVCRCPNLEAALNEGTTFKDPADLRDIIAKDVAPIDDLRSTAAYRLRVLSNLLFHRLYDSTTNGIR